MTNCQNEMKKAVESGYWNLFTFNPALKAQGKNPFTLTSKAVDGEKYQNLLATETRYSRLTRAFPERAQKLFAENQKAAEARYEHLTRWWSCTSKLYRPAPPAAPARSLS